MLYRDRIEGAHALADALISYRGANALILAIPRGAVPMGQVIAERLDGELDVVLVKKLRAPGNPEFAIGAIDESGYMYLSPYAERAGADAAYLARERTFQLQTLIARRASYTPDREPISPENRVAIIVDDGLATGATMIAALHAVRSKAPSKLVCAVPVAAPESLQKVRPYADEVVCLHAPASFYAVGQFYGSFPQVEDEEVIECLRSMESSRPIQSRTMQR